jgi:predicted TIM-barrel fold metal-dependent hydrolase
MEAQKFIKDAQAQISSNPLDRVSEHTRSLVNNPNTIYDPHCHIFDRHCLPFEYFILRTFIGRFGNLLAGNVVRMSEEQFYEKLKNGENIIPPNINDEIDRAIEDTQNKIKNPNNLTKSEVERKKKSISSLRFIKRAIFQFDTNKEILDIYLAQFAIKNVRPFNTQNRPFITSVLMMDIQPGWQFRHQDRAIMTQIDDLLKLTRSMENTNTPILPFLAVDPRRVGRGGNEELYTLFLRAFPANGTSFFGVKIYPSLGYLPSDFRLEPIYKICEEKNIPVLTHCGGNFVSTAEEETSNSFILTENFDPNDRVEIKFNNRKKMGDFLNQPEHWEIVLNRFPNLKLNIAHFGSPVTWDNSNPDPIFSNPPIVRKVDKAKRKETIIGLMENERFKGVYADFSFNISETNTFNNLLNVLNQNPTVRERTMFGTDFWVVLSNTLFVKRRLRDVFKNFNELQEDFIQKFSSHQSSLFSEVPKSYLFDMLP